MTASIRRSATGTIVALGVLLVAAAAEAGPPLICRPFDAGTNAQLLPWASRGQQWNTPDPSYDIQRLTADTMRLLSADAPILARMENMRRATIYATRDPKVAAGLLVAVLARALDANARGSRDSLALFDAGYLVESYRQAVHLPDGSRGGGTALASLGSIDGYALVRRSLELGGNNPEMEFAASLMKEGPLSAEHRRRAVSGAPTGSLLAKNLQN
jgi:hypothetical protein